MGLWNGAELLLVEDNPGDVFLITEAIRENRFDINLRLAVNGTEALDFLKGRGKFIGMPRPDLILLDINLPLMGGAEVLAEIKADVDLRKIPVIVFTSSKAEDEVRRAYNLHANCYIVKPSGLEQFVSIMKSIKEFWLDTVTLPERQ